MKKRIVTGLIALLTAATLMTGCGLKKADRKTETGSAESAAAEGTQEAHPWDFINESIMKSDFASGVMQFYTFQFELGDRLFKLEDQGFQCKEGNFDESIDPGEVRNVVLFYTVYVNDGKGNNNSSDQQVSSIEYLYLQCANTSNEQTQLRNCPITYVRDDKTNAAFYLGVSKGITRGVTDKELEKIYGKPVQTKDYNNDTIWTYQRDKNTCNVFVSKSDNKVEQIEYFVSDQYMTDEQIAAALEASQSVN